MNAAFTRATVAYLKNFSQVTAGNPRYETGYNAGLLSLFIEKSATNSLLRSRLLSNAAWVKTNMTATNNQGIDGGATSGTLLTATAANATVMQTITMASAPRSTQFWLRKNLLTGSVFVTRDGGTTWTDVTAQLNAAGAAKWVQILIENSSVLNPTIGIKLSASGDKVRADFIQDEAGISCTSPLATAGAAITRDEEVVTIPQAGLLGQYEGTIEAWVYYDRTYAQTRRVYDARDTGANNNANFAGLHFTTGGALQMTVSTGSATVSAAAAAATAAGWHHVVGTYDASGVRVYQDGTLVGSAAGTPNLTLMTNGRVGGSNITAGENLNSMIQNLKLRPYALSDAEVFQAYQGVLYER